MLIWVVLLTKPAVPWGVCLHVISILINILKICKFCYFRSPGSMTETRWSRRVSELGPSWWRTTNVSLQFLISSSRPKWNTTTGTSLVRPRTRPSGSRSPSPPGNWKRNNQTYSLLLEFDSPCQLKHLRNKLDLLSSFGSSNIIQKPKHGTLNDPCMYTFTPKRCKNEFFSYSWTISAAAPISFFI